VISFGRTVDKSHTYNITDSDVIPIDRVLNIIKDLGILRNLLLEIIFMIKLIRH